LFSIYVNGGRFIPHTLNNPPVSEFSTPKAISAWIDELHRWQALAEFRDGESRRRLDEAIKQAEDWLAQAPELPETTF